MMLIESWEDFASMYWEQKPVVFRSGLADKLLSYGGYFDTLIRCSDSFRADALRRQRQDVRLLLHEGTVIPGTVDEFLPRRIDGSMEQYSDRVKATFPEGFGLGVGAPHEFSPDLFESCREFLRGLYQATGQIPGGATDSFLLAGRYVESPSGVHKDTASVFLFVLEGIKRVYLWPYEVHEINAGDPEGRKKYIKLRIDYRDYKNSATVLEGRAGDIIYWPSDYWHCAESDGNFHATLHLANYMYGNPLREIHASLQSLVEEQVRDPWIQHYPFDILQLKTVTDEIKPDNLLELMRNILCGPQLRTAWRARRLSRFTALNFNSFPPLEKHRPLQESDIVSGYPQNPIVCWPSEDERATLCSANGHVITIAANSKIVSLCDTLNGGNEIAVGDLIDAATISHPVDEELYATQRADTLSFLEKLYQMRGLRKV